MRLLTAALLAGLLSSLAAAGPDLGQVVITEDISYRTPLLGCELPGIVALIARAAGIPAGVERVPGPCQSRARTAAPLGERERVFLSGVTAGKALDDLIQLDSRYHWADADGMILVRPLAAWSDEDHFLHETLASFAIEDQHMGDALRSWRETLAGNGGTTTPVGSGMRTPLADRRFTIEPISAISAIEALDAIARTHGGLMWEIVYCQPHAKPAYATVFLKTLEHAPDMTGVSLPGRITKVNGKSVDLCGGFMFGQ
jgi:hypothetical protein